MLQIIKPNPNITDIIGDFFLGIQGERFFHPHVFDYENASKICSYTGKDLYYVMINDEDIVGYGLVRGWDEGFEIPSLGIYVSEKYRGLGIARMFMSFLHLSAKLKGSKQIRLKVYKDNLKAIRLYVSLGYVFKEHDDVQFVGTIDL